MERFNNEYTRILSICELHCNGFTRLDEAKHLMYSLVEVEIPRVLQHIVEWPEGPITSYYLRILRQTLSSLRQASVLEKV